MTNLASNLKDASGQFATHPAVRLDDVTLSYADLDDRTARRRLAARTRLRAR